MLHETLPGVSRVAVLANAAEPATAPASGEIRLAARRLGLQLQFLVFRGPEDFEALFRAAASERADALMVLTDPVTVSHRKRFVDLAAKHRQPVIYTDREWAQAGGLMSYGADVRDLYRRAATYVDKILKGAKSADLPVEQPTKFELVINLKTANALGLAIPQSVLVRADEVIR